MDPQEQLDSHRYVFLLSIQEDGGGCLTLHLAEGLVNENTIYPPICGVRMTGPLIEVIAESSHYLVKFHDYVAFSVRNESYAAFDESEEFTGDMFRVFSKSRFLEYVAASTFASAEFPGEHTHYQFVCLDHIVDLASVEPPEITPEDEAEHE